MNPTTHDRRVRDLIAHLSPIAWMLDGHRCIEVHDLFELMGLTESGTIPAWDFATVEKWRKTRGFTVSRMLLDGFAYYLVRIWHPWCGGSLGCPTHRHCCRRSRPRSFPQPTPGATAASSTQARRKRPAHSERSKYLYNAPWTDPTGPIQEEHLLLAELVRDDHFETGQHNNHSIVGGLIETVAAALTSSGRNRIVVPVSLPDEFLDAGAPLTLHERYGLATNVIVERALSELRPA